MELEHIIKIIHTVSDSSLSSFTLEDGDMKLSLETAPAGQTALNLEGVRLPAYVEQPVAAAGQNGKSEGQEIKSPLVGTFYASSSPDAEPFVNVGDVVKKGQILGIVEAMKLMNEIESEYDGVVEAVLVENEQMVEYGQPLFRIKEQA